MSGQKMAYLEAALLKHPLGLGSFTVPGTVYFLASTAIFDPTLTGASVIEPSGGGYARISHLNDSTLWAAVSGSNPASTSNLVQITFATATAGWGTIQSVYVGDASSAGNLLYGTAVTGAGIPIATGSSFFIPVGGFVIRET